jgi:hypothetical protein
MKKKKKKNKKNRKNLRKRKQITMIEARLSRDPTKKWKVELEERTVRFGAKGYQDFTMHKDPKRRSAYLKRHAPNQDWSRAGRHTPGFWARWLLWEHPSLDQAIHTLARKFGIRVRKAT